MADRPSFQFYPKDWRNNAKLQRCSIEARGAWMDVMCILHDSDEYGVLRWPLADIAHSVRLPIKLLRELATKGVLKGADEGGTDYTYAPFHAGKYGEPVTLVSVGDGPCWYCSRFVKDEWKRHQRGKASQFSGTNQPPKPAPKATPKPPFGERQGDGSSSASSSSVNQELTGTNVPDAAGVPDKKPADPIWDTGLAFLVRKGLDKPLARSYLGKFRKTVGDDFRAGAILAVAESQDISDPIPWLVKAAAASAARSAKPSATDDFRGKTYAGTADDDLPESLR
ncbi:MAG: hypothetical protein A3E01_04575 [Gammaproteobacteria bacterium RIFCSPHIGHO2_12_FULL_63_22]|nr:MAG: hypothetical protein A3E01_04575 [Gammaproteobacteria bacterium RIFCSPHIGHO2_12_FULL_63_22]